jgi:hypothetical protein
MWKGNMWGRGNMGNMMNNPGELNKTPIPRPSKFKLLLKNIYDR